MKDYKRLTDRDDDGIPYIKCADCYIRDKCDSTKEVCYQELQDRLAEIEDKIESGEIVGAIWFKSWLNGIVCCGRVVGYDDGGFVIESGNDLISAKKIYTSREQAEKDENKTAEDLPF